MAAKLIQSVFTLGELDPRLFSRTQFEGYFKGARTLRDVTTIPQGGIKRRWGTDYIATIVDSGDADAAVTDIDKVKAYKFDFSATKKFTIVMSPNDETGADNVAINIYLDGTHKQEVTSNLYTAAQIVDVWMIAHNNRVIILHPDVQPSELVRTSDTSWALSAITFGYVPTYDYSVIDGTSYRGTDTFVADAADATTITHASGTGAIFNTGHIGGLFFGGGGASRITAIDATGRIATVVGLPDGSYDVITPTTMSGKDCLLLEAAWGDHTVQVASEPTGTNRGWPTRGAFFQSRLILGRTTSLPSLLFFSNVNDYYYFDDSESLDVNGFSYAVKNEIVDLIGNKGLVVITTGGVETSSIFIDTPLKASNVFINTQSDMGGAQIEVRVVDNQIMYVDENTSQINSASYGENGAFGVIDISVLSPQLITAPTSSGQFNPTTENGSFYLATNTDGTIGILQSLLSQNVQGWTLGRTQGAFKKVAAKGDSATLISRRKINVGATITGAPDNVFTANDCFDAITDITSQSQDAGTDVALFSEDGDYLIIGSEAPFDKIAIALNTAASADIEATFEYYNSLKTWTAFTPTDGTTGFTGAGNITWTLSSDTDDWYPHVFPKHTPDGTITAPLRKFWMRIKRTVDTLTTAPIEDTIFINTADRLFIEDINYDSFMDSNESTTSDSNSLVTGLDHLIGQMVMVRADSVPMGPYFVDSSGEITISDEAASSSDVQVGINFYPEIQPMPVMSQFQYGDAVYRPKHVKSLYVDYYKSLGILVNGHELQGLKIGELVLDETPVLQSQFTQMVPMGGWDPRGVNTISQDQPLPMTIIGVGYEIEVS